MLKAFIAAAGILWAPSAVADGWLSLPIECRFRQDCWVLQYRDHDPGPGQQDYRCGCQSYEGHQGTDFGLSTLADIGRRVPVIAAAQGRVKAVRDGEIDGGRARKTAGKDCGNGVVIDHGGDWSTQYCHMRQGSVAVRKGDVVKTGQPLGEVGLSGNTEFAHLHLTVRYKKQIIDPFSATGAGPGRCTGGQSLWTAAAARALAYSPVDVTAVGIAATKPTMQEAAAGTHSKAVINGSAELLAAWVLAWHVKQGDIVTLRLLGPNGQVVVSNSRTVKRDRTRQFYFTGKRNKGRWPSGEYRV